METEIPPTLNNSHRCDRCGGRAYVLVYFYAKGFLYFCAHHFNFHETAIFAKGGALIHDKREELARG